jgi:hypothetical protein
MCYYREGPRTHFSSNVPTPARCFFFGTSVLSISRRGCPAARHVSLRFSVPCVSSIQSSYPSDHRHPPTTRPLRPNLSTACNRGDDPVPHRHRISPLARPPPPSDNAPPHGPLTPFGRCVPTQRNYWAIRSQKPKTKSTKPFRCRPQRAGSPLSSKTLSLPLAPRLHSGPSP